MSSAKVLEHPSYQGIPVPYIDAWTCSNNMIKTTSSCWRQQLTGMLTFKVLRKIVGQHSNLLLLFFKENKFSISCELSACQMFSLKNNKKIKMLSTAVVIALDKMLFSIQKY